MTITGLAAAPLKINGTAEFAEGIVSANGGETVNGMDSATGAITLTALSRSRSDVSDKVAACGTLTLIGLSIGPDNLDPASGR